MHEFWCIRRMFAAFNVNDGKRQREVAENDSFRREVGSAVETAKKENESGG